MPRKKVRSYIIFWTRPLDGYTHLIEKSSRQMKIVLPENMFFSVQGVRFMTLRDIEIYKEGQRFHSVKEYLAYLQYKHSIVQMPLSKPRTHEPAYLNYGVVPTAQEMEIVQSVYGSRYWSWMTVPVREALAIHYRFGGVL